MTALRRMLMSKALRAALETFTGRPVGLDGFPRLADGSVAPLPYTVLYTLPGSRYSGPPMGDDHGDVEWAYQTTSVGKRSDQVQWLADRNRDFFVGKNENDEFANPIVAAGMTVQMRRVDSDGGVDPEGDVLSYPETYVLNVTRS